MSRRTALAVFLPLLVVGLCWCLISEFCTGDRKSGYSLSDRVTVWFLNRNVKPDR